MSHGVKILLIRVIVDDVVSVANSIGSSTCGFLELLWDITEAEREPSATSLLVKVTFCMCDTLAHSKQTK